MTAYYNEIDPFAVQWLRNLIDAGRIAPGVVDNRSIEDVTPNDLRGFKQVHLFAGFSVWSLALRCAGWPDNKPVWTASCPCQPFSAAGKGAGFADERHLWPAAHWLIGQCRPVVVLGEQSSSKAADDWIDLVQTDVESLDYAFGSVAFPAAGVGAPHIRERAYWLAHANSERRERRGNRWPAGWDEHSDCCSAGRLADTDSNRWQGGVSGRQSPQREAVNRQARCDCPDRRMAYAYDQQRSLTLPSGGSEHVPAEWNQNPETIAGCGCDSRPGPVNGFWQDADWLHCRDGKWRPVKPGLKPLVNGTPGRVGRLRAAGNGLTLQAAIAFIRTVMLAGI
ncbi:DNA cytosine methyltransferase [Pantoea sp. Bo_2]|uniref:DNA cytosine methyltransferase n=1 Tax=unclassified Pantoea TaxID=2630326 RepID=UPI001232E832|nr:MULTISPECIES: DNA cytosine methyltransferase [unclassified Pantoea]KAA5938665.1 DNA cytosine methyltransferase [Pantoea sp. VH_3]KAA5946839.1 DNA cytosine methyltransferase [Pantoea sp. VH_25]KAA5977632.1 DNA cytosine methyltransferase [Pantoea sp. M_3]KAA6041327.1 DNA cytosine methyltransferase [Pantoea sp. FN_2b]KAA6045683.1 DNA cytosine methyltransferase [Pantoea sp. Bo_5]